MTDSVPEKLGKYKIIEEVGRGGFAAVSLTDLSSHQGAVRPKHPPDVGVSRDFPLAVGGATNRHIVLCDDKSARATVAVRAVQAVPLKGKGASKIMPYWLRSPQFETECSVCHKTSPLIASTIGACVDCIRKHPAEVLPGLK